MISTTKKASLQTQVWVLTAMRILINVPYRMLYPFLSVFSRGLGVDLQVLSNVVTVRSLMGVVSPFLAAISDSRSRKTGAAIGLVLFLLGLVVVVAFPTFAGFVAAVMLNTLGKFIFEPAMQAFLSDQVAYGQRGRVLAIVELSWSFSFIFGVPLMGLLIARFGWSAPFPILALLSLGVIFWQLRLLPSERPARAASSGMWHHLRRAITSGPGLAGLMVGLLMSVAAEVINLIFGVWLADTLQLQIAGLGLASLVIGLSQLSGEGLVTWFTDRLGKPRALQIGLILNSLAAFSLLLLGKSVAGALAALFLFYITSEFSMVSAIPLMTEVLPEARTTYIATYIAFQSIGRAGGALLALPLYHWGLMGNILTALVFNLLALAALSVLQRYLKGV